MKRKTETRENAPTAADGKALRLGGASFVGIEQSTYYGWQISAPTLLPPSQPRLSKPSPLTFRLSGLNVANMPLGPVTLTPANGSISITVVTPARYVRTRVLEIEVAADKIYPPAGTPVPANFYDPLFADFLLLREALDGLAGAGSLIDGAVWALPVSIAGNLPLPYDQLLRFTYCLQAEQRSFDLWPGMTLQLTQSTYNPYFPILKTFGALNSYAEPGQRFGITRTGTGALAMSPALSTFAPYTLTASDQPDLVAGFADFGAGVMQENYLRLLLPSSVASAAPTTPPVLDTADCMVLLGASSYETLNAASAALGNVTPGTSPVSAVLPAGAKAVFFPPRCFAQIMLPVQLSGHAAEVPLGSTFAGIAFAGRLFGRAQMQSASTSAYMQRWVMNGRSSASSAKYYPFRYAPDETATGAATVWDVPIMMGDKIWLG